MIEAITPSGFMASRLSAFRLFMAFYGKCALEAFLNGVWGGGGSVGRRKKRKKRRLWGPTPQQTRRVFVIFRRIIGVVRSDFYNVIRKTLNAKLLKFAEPLKQFYSVLRGFLFVGGEGGHFRDVGAGAKCRRASDAHRRFTRALLRIPQPPPLGRIYGHRSTGGGGSFRKRRVLGWDRRWAADSVA